MKKNSQKEFARYVVEDLFGDIGTVSARAMFGGFGVYHNGVMFGLIAESELYLKADDTNEALFRTIGSTPFVYTGHKRGSITMSYWKVPPEIFERKSELLALAESAIDASVRVRGATKGKSKTAPRPKPRMGVQ